MRWWRDWIVEELSAVDFGDKRLEKRFIKLGESFFDNPGLSIPASCNGWHEAKAAYRFFDNEKVTADKILSPHKEATLARISKEQIVLMIQDTTLINYSHMDHEVIGLGKLNREKDQGFLLHPTIAVTPDRRCLGVVESKMWVREELGKRSDFASRTVEEKETIRWLESYRISDEIARNNLETRIINIADREADIHELFMEKKPGNHAEWIVRSSYNRLLKSNDNFKEFLWDKLRKEQSIFELKFELPNYKKQKRPTANVVQEIRAARIILKPGRRIKQRKLKPIEVTAVLCTEINPPKGHKPIEWLLLTSMDVREEFSPIDVVNFYLCRWQIELYFKTLKSGCRIEKLQLDNYSRLTSCIALYMIIAWRIMFITMLARNKKDIECTELLGKEEWQNIYIILFNKTPPNQPPNLYEAVRMIARLGGFLNRKSDGEPGIISIWTGMKKLNLYQQTKIKLNCG